MSKRISTLICLVTIFACAQEGAWAENQHIPLSEKPAATEKAPRPLRKGRLAATRAVTAVPTGVFPTGLASDLQPFRKPGSILARAQPKRPITVDRYDLHRWALTGFEQDPNFSRFDRLPAVMLKPRPLEDPFANFSTAALAPQPLPEATPPQATPAAPPPR